MVTVQEINQAMGRSPRIIMQLGPVIKESDGIILRAVVVKDQPKSTTTRAQKQLLDKLYDRPYPWNNAMYINSAGITALRYDSDCVFIAPR